MRVGRDLTGMTFGMLTVIAMSERRGGNRFWACDCACGYQALVKTGHLTSGATKSCGCLRAEMVRTHGGLSRTPLYKTWDMMIDRCTNPRSRNYPQYGGRGITVCKSWLDYESFLADMGPRPDGTTLDRRDNNLGYDKENCRWATRAEQQQNRRITRLCPDTVRTMRWRFGQGEVGRSLAEEFGVSTSTVSMIVNGHTWKNVT